MEWTIQLVLDEALGSVVDGQFLLLCTMVQAVFSHFFGTGGSGEAYEIRILEAFTASS